jgi:glycosyltransferase involved in cell wall biosynthesis
MKIFFYNHTGKVSGAERVLLMILAHLNRSTFESILACPADGPLSEMAAQLGISGSSVDVLRARFTWHPRYLVLYLKSFFSTIRRLRDQIIAKNPDLIHANSIRAGLVATTATIGMDIPVLWHLHDLLPHHPLSSAIRIFALMSKRTRVLAVSQAVAKNFSGLLFPWRNRGAVLLNAIDLDRFTAQPDAKQSFYSELQLHPADFTVGIVGQITPRKGQLELVRAFANVLAEVPAAVLLIIGAPLFNRDDKYLQLIKQAALDLGVDFRVRFTGLRDDIPAIMQSLDLLVVNSSAEPFGLVAAEAMASGTPVIATACDGLEEIVEHNTNGWLVPARDEHKLAEAIVYLFRQVEVRRRLSTKAMEDATARFSLDRYMRQLESGYRKLVTFKAIGSEQPVEKIEAANLFRVG